jgi:hypothetical protein
MYLPNSLRARQALRHLAFRQTRWFSRVLTLADQASVSIEAGMTAATTERLAQIGDGRGQLGTALRVAAVMPRFDLEFGHVKI